MFPKARLTSILVIVCMAGVAIRLSMAASVDEKSEPAGSQTKAAPEQANGPQPVIMPKANEKANGDFIAICGRVLDPDGKPVARARILLGFPLTVTADWPVPGRPKTGGADGRFEVVLSREMLSPLGPNRKSHPMVAALAPRFGPAWVELGPDSADKEFTLRLRRDDVPIEGRILNLEGRPVHGLNVYAVSLMECPAELLTKVRENAGKPRSGLFWDEMNNSLNLAKEGPFSPVRTGPDGRFHLTGVGRDRAVALLIEGETIEQSMAVVYASSDPTYTPPLLPAIGPDKNHKLLGPRFDFIVAPGRVIEGVIRDRDSRNRSVARRSGPRPSARRPAMTRDGSGSPASQECRSTSLWSPPRVDPISRFLD